MFPEDPEGLIRQAPVEVRGIIQAVADSKV